QDVAFAAYTNLPDGVEAGLEGVHYYDPPNMTYPFGTYAVVVEVDRGTGQWKVKRVVAVDDCGVRINPMIVKGQIMGGLTEGFGIAAMQLITFDEDGNCYGSNFVGYLLPTAEGTPFALATVVSVERPSSARQGDRALVTADGELHGWVGGACTEGSVVREGLEALAEGETRLVRIESGCASEGAVEVLIEPQAPALLLAVVGDAPAARTLRELAGVLGWRVTDA